MFIANHNLKGLCFPGFEPFITNILLVVLVQVTIITHSSVRQTGSIMIQQYSQTHLRHFEDKPLHQNSTVCILITLSIYFNKYVILILVTGQTQMKSVLTAQAFFSQKYIPSKKWKDMQERKHADGGENKTLRKKIFKFLLHV